jgi:hypothetical protein
MGLSSGTGERHRARRPRGDVRHAAYLQGGAQCSTSQVSSLQSPVAQKAPVKTIANRAAIVLNERGIPTAAGSKWTAVQVVRVRRRLEGGAS